MNRSKFSLDMDHPNVVEEIDRETIHKFTKGTLNRKLDNINIHESWQQEDPAEVPSYNFRLRLNKYQIGLLKNVAELEKRSISSMIKVILMEQLLMRFKNKL